jgi:hypothetical protein
MMKIKAKRVVKGVVRGEAIVSRMPISFTGGVDPNTGNVREPGHDLEGKSIAGKILIFPMGKGSTTGSWQFYNGVAMPPGYYQSPVRRVVAVRSDHGHAMVLWNKTLYILSMGIWLINQKSL